MPIISTLYVVSTNVLEWLTRQFDVQNQFLLTVSGIANTKVAAEKEDEESEGENEEDENTPTQEKSKGACRVVSTILVSSFSFLAAAIVPGFASVSTPDELRLKLANKILELKKQRKATGIIILYAIYSRVDGEGVPKQKKQEKKDKKKQIQKIKQEKNKKRKFDQAHSEEKAKMAIGNEQPRPEKEKPVKKRMQDKLSACSLLQQNLEMKTLPLSNLLLSTNRTNRRPMSRLNLRRINLTRLNCCTRYGHSGPCLVLSLIIRPKKRRLFSMH